MDGFARDYRAVTSIPPCYTEVGRVEFYEMVERYAMLDPAPTDIRTYETWWVTQKFGRMNWGWHSRGINNSGAKPRWAVLDVFVMMVEGSQT